MRHPRGYRLMARQSHRDGTSKCRIRHHAEHATRALDLQVAPSSRESAKQFARSSLVPAHGCSVRGGSWGRAATGGIVVAAATAEDLLRFGVALTGAHGHDRPAGAELVLVEFAFLA